MKERKHYQKKGIVLLILCIAAIITGIALYHSHKAEEAATTVSYEDISPTKTTIQQTLSAAGEVATVKAETIPFSTAKTFKGMCVEVKEYVPAGGHIALYSDGTYMCADKSGVVSAVSAPRTGAKGDGSEAVTFLPDDQVAINLTVPEDEISRIAIGNEAKVIINAEPDKNFSGTITYVSGSSNAAIQAEDSAGDATTSSDEDATTSSDGSTSATASGDDSTSADATSTADSADDTVTESDGDDSSDDSTASGAYYKAVVTMDNDCSLELGMSASCTILLAEKKDVLAVPVGAVHITKNNVRYVNVVNSDGSLKKTKVETGISDATYVEIVSGLTGTEKIRVKTLG